MQRQQRARGRPSTARDARVLLRRADRQAALLGIVGLIRAGSRVCMGNAHVSGAKLHRPGKVCTELDGNCS